MGHAPAGAPQVLAQGLQQAQARLSWPPAARRAAGSKPGGAPPHAHSLCSPRLQALQALRVLAGAPRQPRDCPAARGAAGLVRGRALARAHVPQMQAAQVRAAASWLPGACGSPAWTPLHARLPLLQAPQFLWAQVSALCALVDAAALHLAAAPLQPLLRARHPIRLPWHNVRLSSVKPWLAAACLTHSCTTGCTVWSPLRYRVLGSVLLLLKE